MSRVGYEAPPSCRLRRCWRVRNLLQSIIDSALPGIRDARAPLVSGLLWLLLLWMLLAESIAPRSEASAFVEQALDVSQQAGAGQTLGALAVVAYVLGLLGVTLGQAVARGVAALSNLMGEGYGVASLSWQAHAKRQRLELNDAIRRAEAELNAASGSDREGAAKRSLDQATKRRETLAASELLWGHWIRETPSALRLVGRGPQRGAWTLEKLAEALIEDAWRRGAADELTRRNADIRLDAISGSRWELQERLYRADLSDDPTSTLRAIDEGLYQAFDRERAERDFRIAVMPPVAAIAIVLVTALGQWAYAAVVLAGATFVAAAASRQSRDSASVLNQLVLKGRPVPSLVAAEREGRESVRDYFARVAEKKQKAVGPSQP